MHENEAIRLVLKMSTVSVLSSFSVNQGRDVSTTVIGIGPKAYKREAKMREVAGSKGNVLLYADFDTLLSSFEDIFNSACGRKCAISLNNYHFSFIIYYILISFTSVLPSLNTIKFLPHFRPFSSTLNISTLRNVKKFLFFQ